MPFRCLLINGLIGAIALFIACDAAAKDRGDATVQGAQEKRIGADALKSGSRSVLSPPPTTNFEESAPPKLSLLQKASPRSYYRTLIEKEAAGTGLSPEIAESVMDVESGYNPGAVGSSGEIGLMQVMPSTARMMGFIQPMSALAEPETNIHYGVTYLAKAWRLSGGDLCTAVMKYRAGHGETRFSPLSVNYCLAVRSKLKARGIPVFGSVPAANFAGKGPALSKLVAVSCRRGCIGGGGGSRVDFASLNARLTAIVGQVRPDRE